MAASSRLVLMAQQTEPHASKAAVIHQLLVDLSEASPRNSPPHAQYEQNMPQLTETEKHSLLQGAAHRGAPRMPRCGLSLPLVYSHLYNVAH